MFSRAWRLGSAVALLLVVGCATPAPSPWRMPEGPRAEGVVALPEGALPTAPSTTGSPERGDLPDAVSRRPARGGLWFEDESLAREEARLRGRPLFIDVTADWCVPCQLLEADALDDDRVRRALADGFIPLRIDVTEETRENREQQRRYRVRGLPTLLVVDARGVELDRIESYLDAAGLVTRLARLSGPSPE